MAADPDDRSSVPGSPERKIWTENPLSAIIHVLFDFANPCLVAPTTGELEVFGQEREITAPSCSIVLSMLMPASIIAQPDKPYLLGVVPIKAQALAKVLCRFVLSLHCDEVFYVLVDNCAA